jgi:hypothetical protein
MDQGAENTDKEIWRRKPDDYYSPSIHVTAEGGIGMNVGGRVIVMDIEDWFLCALAKTPWPDYLKHPVED